MIIYDNKQNAILLCLRLRGSVFPRALSPAIVSAAIAVFLAVDDSPVKLPNISNPFAVQIFAVVLGYVIVFRTNMALDRYREGITNVQTMTAKWGDAFMQVPARLFGKKDVESHFGPSLQTAGSWRSLYFIAKRLFLSR